MTRADDLQKITNGMATMIDEALNPDGRRTGFALALFDFGDEGPVAFAANASDKTGLKAMLLGLADRVADGRTVPKNDLSPPATCDLCGGAGELEAHARCHPTAPLRAFFDGSTLSLRCHVPDCNRLVVEFPIATTERDKDVRAAATKLLTLLDVTYNDDVEKVDPELEEQVRIVEIELRTLLGLPLDSLAVPS